MPKSTNHDPEFREKLSQLLSAYLQEHDKHTLAGFHAFLAEATDTPKG